MFVRRSRVAIVLVAAGIYSVTSIAAKAADPPPKAATPAAATDNMARYRTIAGNVLNAFKAGDMATAKARSKELEKAWDGEQNDLKAKSPDIWKAIDKAMDAFIVPILKEASPDAGKVQAAYDDYIAKLKTAVKP